MLASLQRLDALTAPNASPDFITSVFLHAADLSAPTHPDWEVVYEWSERVNAEFYAQMLVEMEEGIPTAPYMRALDVFTVRARQQLLFLDYVIAPLWAAMSIAFPEIAELAQPLPKHRAKYEEMANGAVAFAPTSNVGTVSVAQQGEPKLEPSSAHFNSANTPTGDFLQGLSAAWPPSF
jgi:hypothetical protein